MRKTLTLLAAAVLVVPTMATAATVVGRVDNYLILKGKNGYRIVSEEELQRQREEKLRREREAQMRKLAARRQALFEQIVEKLMHGAGRPVYSRIKGFDVERVLDAGPYFGAVISGSPDPKTLRKAFKFVKRVGNKYYVVGEWQ
ncbi:hypothetical protein Theam_1789 (plasmid) [Thermovibrio ammonificans HB-1]|uniref:Uncharacterized protein n=1 Tax=Thermovibrio ammonificans (strain DSM 15698 / JCM 12110 / HB-1) TaxID=648996 RepID=E8T6S2_THEA1|nr:hypothetical protein [Thermovibrio ammonificans]ADU97745.1 hypothetical protein Theam_1789 [Thermovibrio ammonificans HB-1]